MNVFAQAVSAELTSPSSWSHFFSTVGIPAGLLVLFVAGVAFFLYKGMSWTIGKDGWVTKNAKEVNDARIAVTQDMRGAVTEVTNSLVGQQGTMSEQMQFCKISHQLGGVANVADLREAGHSAAEALLTIGQTVKAPDIKEHVAAIHKSLRTKLGDNIA